MPVRTTVITRVFGRERRRPAFEVKGIFMFDDAMPVGDAVMVEAMERIMVPLEKLSLRRAFPQIIQELGAEFPSMISGDMTIRKPFTWAPWFKERAHSTFERARQ